MHSDLWIALGSKEFREQGRNPTVHRLVPRESDDGAPADAQAGIFAHDSQEVRQSIEIAATLSLAPIASEGVGRPLPNFRMLVRQTTDDELTALGICSMVEKTQAIASNAPVRIAQACVNRGESCIAQVDKPGEGLSAAGLPNARKQLIGVGNASHRSSSFRTA